MIAPDAAVQCAKDAIQIFGGIGYTFEHDAHLYYRRALTLRALLGSSAEWAEPVADLALDGVAPGRWRSTCPDDAAAAARGDPGGDRRDRRAGGQGAEAGAWPRAGYVMPHLARPWGRDAKPLEQVLIIQELKAAQVKPPQMIIGAWVVPSLVAYGTPEQQERFLPADAERRDDLVPALLRARRRLRPRRRCR